MNKVPPSHVVIRFGVFELDTENRELRRQGLKVRLQEQPFQILHVLLEHPGKIVTREELRERIWSSDTFVDFDRGLYNSIKRLREALGDSADNPRFIETLSRRGYRFIAAVQSANGDANEQNLTPLTPPESQERRSKKGFQWVLIPALVVVLFASAAPWLSRGRSLPEVENIVQLTNDGAKKVVIACCTVLVSDGLRLYFAENAAEGWVLSQVSVNGGDVLRSRAPFGDIGLLDLSRDGSRILAAAQERSTPFSPIWSVPLPAGSPQRLSNIEANDASWSADREILYAKGPDLYVVKSDGTEPRKLATMDGTVYRPRWSPDRSVIRLSVYNVPTGVQSLWEIEPDGSNPHRLFPDHNESDECCGVWTSDGKYFLYQSAYGGVTAIWGMEERHRLFHNSLAKPIQLTYGPMNFTAPSPSPDGRQIFAVGEQTRGELMNYNAATKRFEIYMQGLSAEGLDFSRDGNWVCYVTYPDGALWRSRTDGTHALRLTVPGLRAGLPRWSPDGKQIAFMGSSQSGSWKIYVISAEGGVPERLIGNDDPEFDASWSSDGKSVVFADSPRAQRAAIHTLNLDNHEVSTLPGSEGLFSPRWSPDGRFIAALSVDSLKLVVFDWRSQSWKALLQGKAIGYPAWSGKGKYIHFCAPRENPPSFYRVRISDGKLERITTINIPRGLASGFAGWWTGLSPEDAPLLLRDVSMEEIYALKVKWH